MRLEKIGLGLSSLLIAAAVNAQPQRTFVSARSGDDANLCSLSSPCRTLQHGVDVVAAGGEVIPLDSGGYGSFAVAKSVTVSVPPGVGASVTTGPGEGPGINIVPSGNTAINVTLRGLALSNIGGQGGIYSTSTGITRIDACSVDNASGNGIFLDAPGMLVVTNSIVTRCQSSAVVARGSASNSRARAIVDHVRASYSNAGIMGMNFSNIAVRDCVTFENFFGIVARATAFSAGTTLMAVERCTVVGNGVGLSAPIPFLEDQGFPDALLMRVSNSTISHNTTGIDSPRVFSRGNNTVADNAIGETFGGLFAAQ